MDSLTQGVIGAVAAQAFSKKETSRTAALCGFLAGLAPDLDVLIRSKTDHLLHIEYHRHFTHSLFFVPFGSLIVSFLLWIFLRKNHSFKEIYFFSILGFSTHGLLDACTTYGTRLLWPFSDIRVAWDSIAIIDPFYTLPLLFILIISLIRFNKKAIRTVFIYSILYLFFGVIQRDRAENYVQQIARERGHTLLSYQAKPTFGQLFLWRLIYETPTHYHVDAVWIGFPFTGKKTFYPGVEKNKLDFKDMLSKIPQNSLLYKDLLRFHHFSNGMLIEHPSLPNVIGDLRYSLMPNDINPLWGIEVLLDQPEQHAKYITFRNLTQRKWSEFSAMTMGRSITSSNNPD